LDNQKGCVPQGHSEKSPAFERRGLIGIAISPAGTAENGAFSDVPAGLDFSKPFPALKCRAIFDYSFGTESRLKN